MSQLAISGGGGKCLAGATPPRHHQPSAALYSRARLGFDAPMVNFRLALSSLAALFAGACDYVIIYYTDQTLPYSIHFIAANIRDGQLPLRIHGDPIPGVDREDFAAALKVPEWMSPPVKLTTRPTGNTRDLAVVMVFNPAFKDSGRDIACKPGAMPPTQAGDGKTLRIAANLCYEGTSISTLYAAGPAPESLEDPKFDRLFSDVMAGLLPKVRLR